MKEEIAEIANQPYIPNAGHLFVFVVDQRRNTLIAEAKGAEALVQGSPERLSQPSRCNDCCSNV